jgi:hypothetical protein
MSEGVLTIGARRILLAGMVAADFGLVTAGLGHVQSYPTG